MRKKLIILMMVITSLAFIGCDVKENNNSSGIIIIDENAKETSANKESIDIKLFAKIRGANDFYGVDFTKFETLIIKDKLFKPTVKIVYENEENQQPVHKIISLRVGEITNEKDDENFNIVKWEDKIIEGNLIQGELSSDDLKIYSEGAVYKVNEDMSLKEIKAYENIKSEYLNYSGNVNSGRVDLLSDYTEIKLVDAEKDAYYEIENIDKLIDLELYSYSVLGLEDGKIYLALIEKNPNGDAYGDRFLKLAYIENNKLVELFDKNDLEVKLQNKNDLISNQVIIKNNKILFSGIIDKVNGIWNYDVITKKLTLEMEIKEDSNSFIYLSPDDKKIVIRNNEVSDNEDYSIYVANTNENLELNNITNIVSGDNKQDIKVFDGFSEDSNRINLECYTFRESDKVNSENYFEIYEIRK